MSNSVGMPFWHRLVIVGVVLLLTAIVARLIDRRIARRDLTPGTATRYRVLRRSITSAVILVGLLSALLVIPQVRAVAGGLLASSAVLGIVIGPSALGWAKPDLVTSGRSVISLMAPGSTM